MLQVVYLILIILQEIQIIMLNHSLNGLNDTVGRMTYDNLMHIKVLVEQDLNKKESK